MANGTPLLNTGFIAARNFTLQRDPLVLDLDGDGLELAPASGNILFDHNSDGIKTGTGWARPDDGFLVRDLNGNGLIDSGRELFGEDTLKLNGQLALQGFDALADLDTNADGDITNADSAWSELLVWRDLNQDGTSQSNELSSLDALNITRIGVNGSNTGPQAGQTIHNNRVALSTTFTRDGADRTVGAIDLDANPFFSNIPAEQVDEAGNPVAITDSARALPQMNGSGMVRDLRAAMSQPGAAADELEVAVASFAAALTGEAQRAQLDSLITEWAQTSSYWSDLETYLGGSVTLSPPAGMSASEYRNMVAVLEVFNGSRFYGAAGQAMPMGQTRHVGAGATHHTISPPANQAELLKQAYGTLQGSVYAALVQQTRLKPYLDAIELRIDESGVSFDTTAMEQRLQERYAETAQHGVEDLIDLMHFAHRSAGALKFDAVGVLNAWAATWPADSSLRTLLKSLDVFIADASSGSNRHDTYVGDGNNNSFLGGGGNDLLTGGDGNDMLSGGMGNDELIGGAGDDVLYAAGAGDEGEVGNEGAVDVLDGGAGNDHLFGAMGSQTYWFGRGDGQDTIVNMADRSNGMPDATPDKQDMLQFKEGISPSDVLLSFRENRLIVRIKGSLDQVAVETYFPTEGATTRTDTLDTIRFADGTSWGLEEVKALLLQGTAGNDEIWGYATDDAVAGLDGNDVINGNVGNDVLDGGAGDDTLDGGAGGDTLLGGEGNDVLYGQAGNDVLMGGAGADRLHAAHTYGGGNRGAADVLDGGEGDDFLRGAQGSQTYRFGRGDGQDTIDNMTASPDTTLHKQDVLQFKVGISASDVALQRSSNHLILKIKGSTDQIVVWNYFILDGTSPLGYALDAIRFEDGTTWSAQQVNALLLQGTADNDTIMGYATDDALAGLDGDDIIDGQGGNDALDGGAGHDWLGGGSGVNTLEGGLGNDGLVLSARGTSCTLPWGTGRTW